MYTINLTYKISRNENVAFTQIDDELVMMDPKDNFFYGVNAVGARIWSLLEHGALSLNEICAHIQHEYNVTKEQCIEDSMQFIHQMVLKEILVIEKF